MHAPAGAVRLDRRLLVLVRMRIPGAVVSVVVIVGAGVGLVRFGPAAHAAPDPASDQTATEVAVAVNAPLRWWSGGSIAGSAYLGVARHHAIRANVASYDYIAMSLAGVAANLRHGLDAEGGSAEGRITDVGVAWMYFPRRLWSGLTLEAGVLVRAKDTRLETWWRVPEVVETDTTTYAGRAQIGWSWLVHRHVFISLAVGISVGYETGTETTFPTWMDPTRTTFEVSRPSIASEGLLRIGGAFAL